MQIITNPGSNLLKEEVERYSIELAMQCIVVDDVSYDTRTPIPLAQIDAWVKGAKLHPYVVGTTAAQFVMAYRKLASREREILVVMTSRKIIKSYDAAVSAVRTLSLVSGYQDLRVVVADTGMTDIGAGLATLLACRAREDGRSLDEVAALIAAFREHARFVFTVRTLDYLVRGGRATALRAWLADLFGVRPLIAFQEGELSPVDKMKGSRDPSVPLTEWVAKEVGVGAAVWAGVVHGDDSALAVSCTERLRQTLDVRYCIARPLTPSIYLHCARGSVGIAVVPLERLPFVPSLPPL